MKNLNKHRKAITEAGYTLSKDGTQVKNKSGKTVAGTNDSGFFSGSKVLTNIFKGDTKGEGKKTESKPASKSSPSKSKRPPTRSTSAPKESGDKYAPPESPNKAPRISPKPPSRRMTKEQARKYTSASPSGIPSLMSQGGSNAETLQKGPERSGAYSVPKPKPEKRSAFKNAKGEDIFGGSLGRLFKREDGGVNKATDKDVKEVKVSDKGMGTINGVTFAEYENMPQSERRAKDLPLKLNKRSWETRVIMESKK